MRIIPYLVGSLIVPGAACYGAIILGMSQVWVVVMGAAILGLGIMDAANSGAPGPDSEKSGPSTAINKVE